VLRNLEVTTGAADEVDVRRAEAVGRLASGWQT